MFKLDIHAHILPKTWPNLKEKFGYSGWIEMEHSNDGKANMMRDDGTLFRPVESKLWSPSERLKDMDATGVSLQVLSTVPVMFSYWAKAQDAAFLCRFLNDHIASVITTSPDRFLGLGTLPMQSGELAVEEMKRCKHQLKLSGVMIGSHVNDSNLDDKQFDMIWKTAQELDMAIFVHPWGMQQGGRFSKYWLPWLVGMPAETTTAVLAMIFGGVLERFPRLKVCFAHGAGMLPYVFGRAEHCFHVYPDAMQKENAHPPSKYIGRIYADSLVHTSDSLKLAMKVLGEDTLILGSDYPFLLGEAHPGRMIEESREFNTIVKEKVYYKNAFAFLEIDMNKYIK